MIDDMKGCDIVGGKTFKDLQFDERVTPDLRSCLYCVVNHYKDDSIKRITYDIPLNCINGNAVKQCPACKTIYILKYPTG